MEQTLASPKTGAEKREIAGTASRPILAAVLSFLAAFWQKIRAGFWSVRNNLNSDITKPLDIERIAAQLAVVKRAEEDGIRDLPTSGEETPTGTQREIIAYFTNLRRRAKQQVTDTAEKSSRILEQIQPADVMGKIRDIPAGCENKILRYFADVESHLANTRDLAEKQKSHYDAFRQKNGLDRLAEYSAVARYSYLIVPVLIGAVAFALASMVKTRAGSEASVTMTWIVTVSAAAVIVPFMLGGSLLRWINDVRGFRRFIGRISAVAAFAAILVMAFYVDFHIDTVLANPDASNSDVVNAMLATPLDVVTNVVSWMGVGLVGLTGLLAMLLAYRSDDPYPGYGTVQRTYYKARDAHDEAASRLRKRINILIDSAESEIDTRVKGFKNKVRTYTRLVEKSQRFPSALNDYDLELEDACSMVLDRYRAANAAVRQSDSPASFAEHVCFNRDGEIAARQHSDGGSHVAELQTASVDLDNEANSARQKLRTLNLRMINSIAEPEILDPDSAD
ncbi:MAG: hypothetical protein HKO12_11330 [Woeseiaceae bacterium]|nr:hypothetical protein [Woeseiaceae bacterium]